MSCYYNNVSFIGIAFPNVSCCFTILGAIKFNHFSKSDDVYNYPTKIIKVLSVNLKIFNNFSHA